MVRQAADAYIISIHTPARGVTRILMGGTDTHIDFNPHSRKGSDLYPQSLILLVSNFNPHSRKGSDQISIVIYAVFFTISIHTPARGVTGKRRIVT